MGYLDPIAYTYDADYHCPDCARKRFGETVEGWVPESAEDSEGNPVGAVSPWSEWFDVSEGCESLYCGDCHAILDTAHTSDCVENFGTEPCTLAESEVA